MLKAKLVFFLLLLNLCAGFQTGKRISWSLSMRSGDDFGDDFPGLPKKKFTADNKDFITNLFGRFFPAPEEVGLNRFTKESLPENYPATKTEWAEPVEGDSASMAIVRQCLKNTNLETRKLQLAYSGTRDGFSYKTFHLKVDNKGPAILLATTKSGEVVGGYNPCGWVNLGEARGNIAAFLFAFKDGDVSARPIKLQKIAGAGLAQVDDGYGPRFGAEGLTIPLEGKGQSARLVRCKLGLYYERMPSGANTLFDPDFKGKRLSKKEDELESLEIFTGVYEEDETIPYSGAMFFQIN